MRKIIVFLVLVFLFLPVICFAEETFKIATEGEEAHVIVISVFKEGKIDRKNPVWEDSVYVGVENDQETYTFDSKTYTLQDDEQVLVEVKPFNSFDRVWLGFVCSENRVWRMSSVLITGAIQFLYRQGEIKEVDSE